MKSIIKRISAVCTAAFLCFTIYISNITIAQADSFDYSALSAYDETSIYDDLEDLNIDLYPKVEGMNGRVIRFSEYCYTEKSLLKDYYGLYFYVYNPCEKPIYEYGNVVNMATAYDEDGKPINYENVKLTLLDGTDEKSKYPNRFFKFKIEKEEKTKAFYDMAYEYSLKYNGERRYDIAGLQLAYKEGEQKIDLSYGKTYYMSGFSKGFGSEAESTLTARSSVLETLELDVNHTYYRTGDYNNFVCDELNTVYFSVPDSYFEKYGNLQKIKAEWYEYKTSPVFVTSDESAYKALEPYIGKDLSNKPNMSDEDFMWRVVWEEKYVQVAGAGNGTTFFLKSYNGYANGKNSYMPVIGDDYSWNIDKTQLLNFPCTPVPRMDWLFKQSDVKERSDFNINAEKVQAYMQKYTENHPEQYAFGIRNKYAENLFTDSIDEDRIEYLSNPNDKRGHIVQEIDAGEEGKLTFEKDNSWWHTLWHGIEYEEEGFSPIVQLRSADLSGLRADEFADQYYVQESEAERVFNDCKNLTKDKENTVVLFRFATTDYYASPARFDKAGNSSFSGVDGYVAQETVFLDFDVISLTFRSGIEGDTVIPVVADPIDIINGYDAPPGDYETDNFLDRLKEILTYFVIAIAGIVCLVIVAMISAPILPYILQGIVWVITAPFKGIGLLINWIASLINKDK